MVMDCPTFLVTLLRIEAIKMEDESEGFLRSRHRNRKGLESRARNRNQTLPD